MKVKIKEKQKKEWSNFFRLGVYNLGETLKKVSGAKPKEDKTDKKVKKK